MTGLLRLGAAGKSAEIKGFQMPSNEGEYNFRLKRKGDRGGYDRTKGKWLELGNARPARPGGMVRYYVRASLKVKWRSHHPGRSRTIHVRF